MFAIGAVHETIKASKLTVLHLIVLRTRFSIDTSTAVKHVIGTPALAHCNLFADIAS